MSSPLNLSNAQHALDDAGITTPLTLESFQRIERYFARRQEWATAHNLAGPKSLQEPLTDLIDACALTHCLNQSPLVDVGTGSGTPGLLIACLAPERAVVLVEPLAKRTAFLKSISYELGLTNIRTIRSKWPYDVGFNRIQVVSRAVVSPSDWPQMALRGGPSVKSILRMLAHIRPQMRVPNFQKSIEIEYEMRDGSHRLIQRWDHEEND